MPFRSWRFDRKLQTNPQASLGVQTSKTATLPSPVELEKLAGGQPKNTFCNRLKHTGKTAKHHLSF